MSVLLAILAAEGDNERLQRHWKYFKKTGFDILGCGTEDQKVIWPEKVPQLNIGKLGKRMTPAGSSIFGLIEHEIEIWRYFLDRTKHDSVVVVEADNIFVRKPPEHPGDGLYLVTLLPNYSQPGVFQTPIYFSTPRWADRIVAKKLLLEGHSMWRHGDTQHDMSDRFPAWICQKHKIPYLAQPAWSPSAFHWGAKDYNEAWVRDARAAIKIGCYALHSIKHEWQLDAIRDLIKI